MVAISPGEGTIQEPEKLRLVEHLLERSRGELLGRSSADIWEGKPSRLVFGGVLQPLRPAESASHQPQPSKTSVGLDFRLDCPDGTEASIEVSASWTIYYPVFPGYAIACHSTAGTSDSGNAAGPDAVADIGTAPSAADEHLSPSEESASREPGGAVEGEQPGKSDQHAILPVAWRRKRVTLAPQTISCTREGMRMDLAADEIKTALERATAEIGSDPGVWRHLDEPKTQSRMMDARLLGTPKRYSEALRAASGSPVACPPWSARLSIDTRAEPGSPNILRVRVLLANCTPHAAPTDVPDPGLEERNLFDAQLQVSISGAELRPFKFLLAPEDYRTKPSMDAKGVNCVARKEPSEKATLYTETLPIFRQPLLRTRDLGAVAFSSLTGGDCIATLEQVGQAMRSFEDDWKAYLAAPEAAALSTDEVQACAKDLESFQSEIERYSLGIECLRRDSSLHQAFRLANVAFRDLGAALPRPITAWRAFQIGFIVSQLPSLAVRNLPGRDADDDYSRALAQALSEVGILWFPTGGGKTEAYLGLLAIALLFDRLRGRGRGVTAWMRFPLRMLSLQQLERLGRVIAQLNVLRATEPALVMGDPFAMGYFVGAANTPNSIDAKEMPRLERDVDLRERARVLRKCPYCGSRISIQALRAEWRLAHVCENSGCFSNTSKSLGRQRGSLPLYMVDSEIYRYLPSVLVGTVDKLALIGRSRLMHLLLRGPRQECPDHGYCAFDECTESWSASCKRTKSKLTKLQSHKDPGLSLLIQDELHLLEAELGTFNGHYEGLLQRIGRIDHLPPKVLAATATIESYDAQAFHLYLSSARRFPQPAWRQAESFYATALPPQTRRIYVGVPVHGRLMEDCAARLLLLYWKEVRRLQASPRELASIIGCPDATDESLRALLRIYDFSLGYVNRKATAGALLNRLQRVDRSLAASGAAPLRGRTLTGDNRIEDVGATLERIQHEQDVDTPERLDAVFATSLISHGVDLERINMMIMAGTPSRYAEYIQSSSRCARANPGIVFTCLDVAQARETSQYEFFEAIHENLDRLVEAVAVNRFASFAARKTVPGLLMGLLLCEHSPRLFGHGIGRSLDNLKTAKIALGLSPGDATNQNGALPQAELLAALLEIIGTDSSGRFTSAAQTAATRAEVERVFADQMGIVGRSLETRTAGALSPLASFRDVDEGIDFMSPDSATLIAHMQGGSADER